ncbi:S1 RNA-binding domain-containing protein, partial [Candidatus Saccharibacteria bacterium]|nr:S1 RNA-binding domain-containing protein [Candidatus Saccharibacteria bacterium]
MANAKKVTMDELLASSEDSFKKVITGDTVEGKVLSVKKHEILIDLGAQGVGLVPRREASFARNLNVGDDVTASVVESEMDDGYVLLSLRKAVKDKGWDEIVAKLDNGETVEI